MGIIQFLVDTSASMNQRCYLGTSYLDVAKGAIDTFMKYRSRDPASRGDRYMLVSFDEVPYAVKTGWKENHTAFIAELKKLRATSLSTFGRGLRESFDLLNIHRLHTSIDHYGQGRNPFYLEPVVTIALSDGGRLSNPNTVERELTLPLDNFSEGSELTKVPFRWDQRLFTVLLRLPGLGGANGTNEGLQLAENSVSTMCEATGGKCYVVSNQKSLVQCMESLTQKLHPGVVVNFQKIGGASPSNNDNSVPIPMEIDQPNDTVVVSRWNREYSQEAEGLKGTPPPKSTTAWQNTRKMIYVKSNPKSNVPSGFWPIPESFWPDANTTTLPPRDAHPVVWFNTVDMPPMLVENFPFDKYELEPSPLTQYILERRNPNVCWQVFVESSGKQEGLTDPFGYLKASVSLTHVTLFVMPYNYPVLLPLIEELQKHRLRPPPRWRADFENYMSSIPSYYAQPIRNALRLMGANPNLIPDRFNGQLSYTVTNYLRKLKKQAKVESDRIIASISKDRANEAAKRGSGTVDLGNGISIAIGATQVEEGVTLQSFHNPFDIARSGLLGQLERMRTNFLHATPTTPNLIEEVSRHEVPIGQMGNYQEHLKRISPLRELDSGAVRTQLFGNPFKLERSDPKQRDVDIGIFADEHMVEMNRRPSGPTGRKRRLRSLSPRSPKPPPPPPTNQVPNGNNNKPTLISDKGQLENTNPLEETVRDNQELKRPLSRNNSLPSASEGKGTLPEVQVVEPETTKGDLEPPPEQHRNNAKSPLDKVQQVSRKRERTPSPTPNAVPPSKRQALGGTNDTAISVKLKTSTGQNHGIREPSPVQVSHLPKPEISSVSKVLNEEIQKQQGQENTRLKTLIVKEVRKPGKNYDTIFQHLEGVRGSVEVRKAFVLEVIREAGKFKRKQLIQQLEDWGTKLTSLKTGASEQKSLGKTKGGSLKR